MSGAPEREQRHHEYGDLGEEERMEFSIDVFEKLRVPVFVGELVEPFVFPAVEHLFREGLRYGRVAIEKSIVAVRERPEPGNPPAGADGVVDEVADGAEREEERPGRAEHGRKQGADRDVEERVVAEVAVPRDGTMVTVAVAEENVPKIKIRQEREGDAEPHEQRPEFQRKGLAYQDRGEDSDADVEQHDSRSRG